MKCAYLSIRLAVEAIFGVAMLFNCARALIVWLEQNLTIANIVGVILGSALIYDAFRLRRKLNQLDPAPELPAE